MGFGAGFGARAAAVDGRFYPGDADELRREVEALLGTAREEQRPLGVVAPHAGYVYSGKVAGKLFARVRVPDVVCVMGPNPTGRGTPISLRTGGEWQLPGARMSVDAGACAKLIEACRLVEQDERAHQWEHSVEVELP